MYGQLFGRYERLLRRSLEILGVDRSVERKILAAVGIQFGVSVAQAVIPFVVTGTARLVLVGLLSVGAGLAFFNTVLITRNDVVRPIERLERVARTIASGDLDVDVRHGEQRDEIGSLVETVADMEAFLTVVAAQADALAEQRFEADVLDEEVPGTFGDVRSTLFVRFRGWNPRTVSTRGSRTRPR